MQISSKTLWALALCYFFTSVIFLAYLMYTATVNLPSLPEDPAIYWWRDASHGRYILRHTCTRSDVVCDKCCYCYTPASHILADFGELSQAMLTERRCEQRLPQAIIIGRYPQSWEFLSLTSVSLQVWQVVKIHKWSALPSSEVRPQ